MEVSEPFYLKKWADQENEIDYRHGPLCKSHLKIIWFESRMIKNPQELINNIVHDHASCEQK